MSTKKKLPADKQVNVVRAKTKQITLPEGMSYDDGITWLKRQKEHEEKEVELFYELDCFPLDGAVSFRNALDDLYGFVESVATPGFFRDNPPRMIGVPVSETEEVQVPWGDVRIPGVYGILRTGMKVDGHGPRFVISGYTKQKHLSEVDLIVQKTKECLKNGSIYKGKAVKLDLSWTRKPYPEEHFDPQSCAPKFSIKLDKVREEELILPKDVEQDVQLGLFTPIEHSEACRANGIPLRRGVLLSGEYGTGKTLTAYVTAKKAVENGWTFIYLSNVVDLAAAFKFAKQYSPAIIFAEDIDGAIAHSRNEESNAILNSFDGIDSKETELITVLTTNHLDNISLALLRPGRCDTLVQVSRPDAEAAVRLVQLYGRGLFEDGVDFTEVGEALQGHLPAEIREAVERAKLAAVRRRSADGTLKGKNLHVKNSVLAQDVLSAVHAMQEQHNRLKKVQHIDNRSDIEKAATVIANGFANLSANVLNEVAVDNHQPERLPSRN